MSTTIKTPDCSYDTPEFLAWTLALPCSLRTGSEITSPETTERHLRAARAAGEGIAENRVRNGICLSRADAVPGGDRFGFRIEDALSVYGGLAAAETACAACPANVANALGTSTMAGCYGELRRTDDRGLDWAVAFGAVVENLGLDSPVSRQFAVTGPLWYGLWISQPLGREQLELLSPLWGDCLRSTPEPPADARLFGEALARARHNSLSLYVELHPPGAVDAQGNWTVAASCPQCRAVWEPQSPKCAVCDWIGHHIGPRKRKLRGRRPFRPLPEFLSMEEIERVAKR